ncbi:hypothetical protein COCSUDRAFT_62810 [Coccomyxa subellipsoidea C-169]|uniref:Protein kinase domain-containing protein n=1 Tax=Coccomyxa subellipsoidea (strain C-169) TaxID=574566 RepID=I0Z0Z1_COCSC|nr:hypothetical protein COCSUDRAFT_62810 [Coccomyxa subellipsoidea C-169]EIE24310.1 hypothetical protein COCSUDRAFT_62810 [Coccomyxa subellipsoidea C-169]|eukprot:XP_005648854.1 hypothetical protein COCSUDRAFT_62810 [Coccomyxa subellipsoidea C-169]
MGPCQRVLTNTIHFFDVHTDAIDIVQLDRTEAVKVLWAGRVDALVIPPQIGYLAEFQEWDTLLLVEYLAGASLQPEDLAGAVAKDRLLDQQAPAHGAAQMTWMCIIQADLLSC